MQKNLMAVAALGAMLQAASAEAWNCQLSNHSGLWQADGADLVGPLVGHAVIQHALNTRDRKESLLHIAFPNRLAV